MPANELRPSSPWPTACAVSWRQHDATLCFDGAAHFSMNWPLPLTPIEELFFTDDRPAYPSCCFVRARFSGCFEKAKMESAIGTAVQRHPLLTAKVERRGSRQVWAPAGNPRPSVVWRSQPAAETFPPAASIDLRVETGLRFQVHEHDSGSILYIQFHHAVCDGVGIFQLLHEILLEYAAANGPVEQKPWLDFDRWERARLGVSTLPIAKQLTLAGWQLMNLWAVSGFIRRLPSALHPRPADLTTAPPPATTRPQSPRNCLLTKPLHCNEPLAR